MTRPGSSLEHEGGDASGSREDMTGPTDGGAAENALHDLELETRGELLEGPQRVRDSNGVADGYDDSVDTRRRGDTDYRSVTRGD